MPLRGIAPRPRDAGLHGAYIIIFSKYDNKLRRAANDSHLVIKQSLMRVRNPLNYRSPFHSAFSSPSVPVLFITNLYSCIACTCGTNRSCSARRRTSTTGLFIRESNYASSSPGFIGRAARGRDNSTSF